MYKKDKDGLSPRESEFCRAVAKGENPSAAYRRIWQADSAQARSIHTAASRLIRRAEVQRRLSTLQAQIQASFVNKTVSQAVADKSLVLDKLRQIINEEITVKSEVIRSLELLGRTQALFSDTVISKEAEASSEDIAAQIAGILRHVGHDSHDSAAETGDDPVH